MIYYLRDNTQLDKAVLFEWFRQIAGEIRKYQQSKRGQNYRCLTPYSIVVTEEGELLLLNPDAQENEFVMKKMQQKAVRSHFIRPTASGSRKNCSVDLFGYGKILQQCLTLGREAVQWIMDLLSRMNIQKKQRHKLWKKEHHYLRTD